MSAATGKSKALFLAPPDHSQLSPPTSSLPSHASQTAVGNPREAFNALSISTLRMPVPLTDEASIREAHAQLNLLPVEDLRRFSRCMFDLLNALANVEEDCLSQPEVTSETNGGTLHAPLIPFFSNFSSPAASPCSFSLTHTLDVDRSPMEEGLEPNFKVDRNFRFGEQHRGSQKGSRGAGRVATARPNSIHLHPPDNAAEASTDCLFTPVVRSVVTGMSPRQLNASLGLFPPLPGRLTSNRSSLAPRASIAPQSPSAALMERANMMRRAQRRLSSVMINPRSFQAAAYTTGIKEVETEDSLTKVNQYLFLEVIGRGAQGVVYLAYDEDRLEFRAVKEVRRPFRRSAAMQQLRNEIEIMKNMRHKNIVSLHEVLDDPRCQRLYLVMQYIEHGALVQYEQKTHFFCEAIPATKFAYYARQICAGLTYLHGQHILHRDIKPENILLGNDDVVYLADFGVSQMRCQTPKPSTAPISCDESLSPEEQSLNADAADLGRRGTPAFFAPELVEERPDGEDGVNGPHVDVWALGVTFFMLLSGHHPFVETHEEGQSLAWEAMRGRILTADVVMPDDLPAAWGVIIAGMLRKDWRARMSLPEVRSRVKDLNS